MKRANKNKRKPRKLKPEKKTTLLTNVIKMIGDKIITNPSKSNFFEEENHEYKFFEEEAKANILINDNVICFAYHKMKPIFKKMDSYFTSKGTNIEKEISKKNLLIKFFLQLKYIKIIYLDNIIIDDKKNKNIKNLNINLSSYC